MPDLLDEEEELKPTAGNEALGGLCARRGPNDAR
jgi:hypothetical protein